MDNVDKGMVHPFIYYIIYIKSLFLLLKKTTNIQIIYEKGSM